MIFLRRAPDYDPNPYQFWLNTWTSGWKGGCVLFTVFAVAAVCWKGSEIYHQAKIWRAERLIGKSEQARDRGDYPSAAATLRRTTALLPRDPVTIRAVARFQAEVRDLSVINTCLELMKSGQATTEDKAFFACQAFRLGRPNLVATIMADLKNSPGARDSAVVQALQAEESFRDGRWADAIRLARRAGVVPATNQDNGFARLMLARLLLQAGVQPQSASPMLLFEGQSLMESLALRHDVIGIEALEELVNLAKNRNTAGLFLHQNVQFLIDAVEKHPLAVSSLRVDSWSLRVAADPQQEAAITREFFERFKHEPSLRLDAARWLNQRGLHTLVLELAEPAKFESQDWFVLYLDATAALGKWKDVFRALTARDQKVPLAPSLGKLFQLRSAIELDLHPDINASWSEIIRLAGVESVENQLYVAGYAEQFGYPAEAAEIFRRLLDQRRDSYGVEIKLSRQRRLACYTGLLRTGARAMTLKKLCERVSAFAAEFPEIDEVQNDNAYLQLLSGGDFQNAERTAGRLLQKQPQLLAYRTTVAFSELKRQRADAAAALYDGWTIDWNTARDEYKAVYAAVMRAAGRKAEAEVMAATIKTRDLRPEERLLAGLP